MDLAKFKRAAMRSILGPEVTIWDDSEFGKLIVRARKYSRKEADEIRSLTFSDMGGLSMHVIREIGKLRESLGREPGQDELAEVLTDDEMTALLKSSLTGSAQSDTVRRLKLRYGIATVKAGAEEDRQAEGVLPDATVSALLINPEIGDAALKAVDEMNPFLRGATSSTSETSPNGVSTEPSSKTETSPT